MYQPKFNGDVTIFYGPPGTGKTKTLLDVIAKELEDVNPDEIAMFTFTREGARQGIRRACQQFDYKYADFPYFRTMHSLSFHALELTKDQVFTPYQYNIFGKSIGMNFLGHFMDDIVAPDDEYLFIYDLIRNNKEQAKRVFLESNISLSVLQFVINNFKQYKEELKIMDFTDMITAYIIRDMPLPVKVGIIDEAQDLTTLQWQMAEVALRDAERVYIAGDDDQAIYTWSGADVGIFARMEGKKKVLDTSYRLTPSVLNFAKTIANKIDFRVNKEYHAIKEDDSPVQFYTDICHVPLDYPGSYLILARNRKFVKEIKEFLMLQGYYFKSAEGNSARAKDVITIKAWNRWQKEGIVPSETEAIRLSKAIGEDYHTINKDIPWQKAFVEWDEDYIDYVERILENHDIDNEDPLIYVSTIHTVKGGEADNVVLYTGMSERTRLNLECDPDSEHRVFYVGATRASKRLMVVFGNDDNNYPVDASV